MSLTLLTTPEKTVNGLLSNVVALNTQIPFTFNRLDATGITVYNEAISGFVGLAFTVGDGTDLEFSEEGDFIYCDFAGVYEKGLYQVVRAYLTADPVGVVALNLVWTSDTTTSVNLTSQRRYYNVAINIIDNDTGETLLDNPVRYRPKQAGSLFVDLSGLFFGLGQNFDAINMNVTYAESWSGQDYASVSVGPYLGLPAKKQVMNQGGSNMWEYLPNIREERNVQYINLAGGVDEKALFNLDGLQTTYLNGDFVSYDIPPYKGTAEILDTNTGVIWMKLDTDFIGEIEAGTGMILGTVKRPAGMFLTDFEELNQTLYFTRTLSFIIDSNLLARTGADNIDLSVESYNDSDTLITTTTTNYSTIGLNTYTLPRTNEVNYYLIKMLGGASGTDILSETKRVNQEQFCKNPMLIEWENRIGAKEQHVFDVTQLIEDEGGKGLMIESPINDTYDLADNTLSRIPIEENQTITLTAQKITVPFFNALKQIKKGSVVNLYLNPSGSKKISVAVIGSYKSDIETADKLVDFTLKIQLPQDFTIENAWR